MKKLKSFEIRRMWLDFFASKGHDIIPSASLIPVNDPTLLWINAGIAPLKKYFDGREIPKNKRMTNSQKSIRTNDIENVGKTARHHTFFEMLGNFSIGDYFREEALTWAIELLTSPKYYDLDLDRLYFTIYPDDKESFNKWMSLGVKEDHIIKLEDNFWEIGEGPCGPDTEIFFDRGEIYDPNHLGIKMLKEDIENDRYVEIWNIVFSQYNSISELKRKDYPELPNKNIDTGCGLERMACIMQETPTNYETDLFMPIIEEAVKITKVAYTGQMAYKVIADHIRSVTFAISDGANLSNEGRGYVLRRILRRASRYGKKLGMNEPFLYRLVETVSNNMIDYYPYLQTTKENVQAIVKQEEVKFLATLDNGEKRLLDYMEDAKEKVIDGKTAFLLYDTFGFPFELTLEACAEKGFSVDEEGFKSELNKQKERARAARSDTQSMNSQNEEMMNFKKDSLFIGYTNNKTETKVIGIFKDGNNTQKATGQALVVFETTVFYAESGGQVGDEGFLTFNNKTYKVLKTLKMPNMQHASLVDFENDYITLDDNVVLQVNQEFRDRVTKNHSGTHLLNESLRRVLGEHLHQLGSYVANDGLHFDFNNFKAPTNDELIKVEKMVNEKISDSLKVVIKEMPIEEAKKMGAQMVFGDKYGDIVRVVDMDFSKEFCGGCHVENTKDIERLVILGVESKGSGVFRIEAITGENVEEEVESYLQPLYKEFNELNIKATCILNEAKKLNIEVPYNKVEMTNLPASFEKIVARKNELSLLRENVKELEKNFNKIKKDNITFNLEDYEKELQNIKGYNVIITRAENLEIDLVKDLADKLANKVKNCVVFVANVTKDKVIFVCKNLIPLLNAGMLVKEAAIVALGNGGGRNDFAQAGGKDVTKTDEALDKVKQLIEEKL